MIGPEPESQLERDIINWADMRLRQWTRDSADRFDQAGIPAQRALVSIMTLLISLTVDLVAKCSFIPVQAFGSLLAAELRRARKKGRGGT